MAIKCLTVKVHRSEVTEPVVTVRAWELPLLEAMHPTVEVVSEAPYALTVGSAADEYRRLVTVYGRTTNEDGSRGLPYVAAVYGQFQLGERALEKAILAATVDEPAEPEKPYSNIPDSTGQVPAAPAAATDLLGATA